MNEILSPSVIVGETRSFTADIQEKGYLRHVNYKFDFEELQIQDKPIIFAANHFVRQRKDRRTINLMNIIFNTRESMLVAGIISIGGEKIGRRTISWVIEEELEVKVGEAAKQKSFIKTYDHIPMSKYKHEKKTLGGGSETYTEIAKRLTRGKNIAVFTEGDPGQKMRGKSESLAALLTVLRKRKKIDFQVIPVSIFYEDRTFKTIFSKPVQSGDNPRQDAADVILAIASKLPHPLRP